MVSEFVDEITEYQFVEGSTCPIVRGRIIQGSGVQFPFDTKRSEVQFPNMDTFTFTPPQTIKFMHHKRTNIETRGSALRPFSQARVLPRTAQSMQ